MTRSLIRSSLLAFPLLVACSGDDTSSESNSGDGTDSSGCFEGGDPGARGGQCPASTGDTVTATSGSTGNGSGDPTSGPSTGPTSTDPTTTDPTSTGPTTGATTGVITDTEADQCVAALQPFIDALGIDPLGAAMLDSPLGNEMTHSDGIDLTTSEGETDIGWYGAVEIALGADVSAADFPCGDHAMGTTVCPGTITAPTAGDYVVMAMVLADNVPLDGSYWLQFGFVFDGDGDTSNNYEAGAAYPKDFWQRTDRWVGVTFEPGYGWTVQAQDATNGNVTTIPNSMARVIVVNNAILLLIPKSEIGAGPISYRATAFAHTGTWGSGGDYWNGDACPQVDDGLTAL